MRALTLALLACAHAPVAASYDTAPTVSAKVVVAELGNAGVSPEALNAWVPDGGDAPAQAVRGIALLPAGWHEFGPSCVVPAATCVAAGRKLAGSDAEVTELERVPPGVRPELISAVVGFGLGLIAGVAVGGVVFEVLKR